MANFTVNDGKGTPVAHVFTQDAQQNGSDPAEFVNRSNTNGPSFWERFMSWVTLSKGKTQPHVVKLKLNRPIPGTDVNSNPIVKGKHEAILTLLIDPTVTSEADVLDTLVMVANLADLAWVRTQIKQFAPLLAP